MKIKPRKHPSYHILKYLLEHRDELRRNSENEYKPIICKEGWVISYDRFNDNFTIHNTNNGLHFNTERDIDVV